MKIHQLRNATIIIESGDKYILVDPMLGGKGTLPAFAYFRFPKKANPLVDLPENAQGLLDKTTHCLQTHCQRWGISALQHTDHLDLRGKLFLLEQKIPLTALAQDRHYLEKKLAITVNQALDFWRAEAFLDGKITAVPATHGISWISRFMAHGAGYFIKLPDEPSLYISGDTVYTEDVERVLTEFKPDICILAAGSAQLDFGTPILMDMDEILRFVKKAPGKVIANHLEALNHCPTTRYQLAIELELAGLRDKVFIPADGEAVEL